MAQLARLGALDLRIKIEETSQSYLAIPPGSPISGNHSDVRGNPGEH